MNSLSIAPFSDLHLEFSGLRLQCDSADVVVLAGDILASGQASMETFNTVIDWAAGQIPDQPIVFVPGNHDFENSYIDRQLQAWKDISLSRYNGRVHVLWNEAIDIGGVRFLGTPLFTDFSSTGDPDRVKEYAARHIVDFKKIGYQNRVVNVDDYVRWFEESVQWLKEQLSQDENISKVVVTHFSPSLSMNKAPRGGDPLTSAYWCSNLEDLVQQSQLWISGHTHFSIDRHIGDDPHRGHLVSNARGVSKMYDLSSDPAFRLDKRVLVDIPHLSRRVSP